MYRNFKVFDTAYAGSILQIEPKRFDSGYPARKTCRAGKPEPTKVVEPQYQN